MKAKSNKTVWITVAAVVVIAAVIRLYNNQNTSDDVLFTDFIRSLLHIGLITAWGFSIYQRVDSKAGTALSVRHCRFDDPLAEL